MALLVRHNYIRPRPAAKRGPGRPASPVYEVNPAFGSPEKDKKRPENSENPGAGIGPANSQNIQSAFGEPENGIDDEPEGRVFVARFVASQPPYRLSASIRTWTTLLVTFAV
ncbi:MAG: hypothetical protein ACLQLG_20055 [Thermoguttaceae bacterium]